MLVLPDTSTVVTMRHSRSTRDDSELSRKQKNMKRNSSLVATARLSMGEFILSNTGESELDCDVVKQQHSYTTLVTLVSLTIIY